LALPICQSDLSNFQHYNFNSKTQRSHERQQGDTLSIFQQCLAIEKQLVQLGYFRSLISAERKAALEELGPREFLQRVFHNTELALLELFSYLDGGQDMVFVPSEPWRSSFVDGEIVETCARLLGATTDNCPTLGDLAADDTTGHIKLVWVLQKVLSLLTLQDLVTPVDTSLQWQHWSCEGFLLSEREYLCR